MDQMEVSFDLVELKMAANKPPPEKWLGPDGVFNEVIAAVKELIPIPLLKALNVCLTIRTFPRVCWVVVRIIFVAYRRVP